MDRGREIDKSQNLNARYIDQFQNGAKTSVKTSNPPGWSQDDEKSKQPANKFNNNNNNNNYQQPKTNQNLSGKKGNQPQDPYYGGNYGNNYGNNQYGNSYGNNPNNSYGKNNNSYSNQNETADPKTSVKYAPGGQSNISFGSDNIKYDDFRKNR